MTEVKFTCRIPGITTNSEEVLGAVSPQDAAQRASFGCRPGTELVIFAWEINNDKWSTLGTQFFVMGEDGRMHPTTDAPAMLTR